MTAYEKAMELGISASIEKVQSAGLMEYGIYRKPFAGELLASGKDARKTPGEPTVWAGLNNADLEGVLLALLRENPEKILDGLKAAAYITYASRIILCLPAREKELIAQITPLAEKENIEVRADIVDVRKAAGDLVMHIVTAADLADLFTDRLEKGVYISTDGKTLKKVPEETKLGDLFDFTGAKGVFTGYQYYKPETAAQLTAQDTLNGAVTILKESDCIVDQTQKRLLKDREVSCGKCVFCREGLIQLEYEQKEITEARGKADFKDLTEEIGTGMLDSTLCSVGQYSSKAALSAMDIFADEYNAHIKDKKCPAGVCGSFSKIYIDPMVCTGCGDCLDVCPEDSIEGKPKFIHMIDEFECTKCGKCIDACEEGAIVRASGKLPKLPDRLTKVGRFRRR